MTFESSRTFVTQLRCTQRHKSLVVSDVQNLHLAPVDKLQDCQLVQDLYNDTSNLSALSDVLPYGGKNTE